MFEAVDDVHGFDARSKGNAPSLSATAVVLARFSHAAGASFGLLAAEGEVAEFIADERIGAIVEAPGAK